MSTMRNLQGKQMERCISCPVRGVLCALASQCAAFKASTRGPSTRNDTQARCTNARSDIAGAGDKLVKGVA